MRTNENEGNSILIIILKIVVFVFCIGVFFTQFYWPIKDVDFEYYKQKAQENKENIENTSEDISDGSNDTEDDVQDDDSTVLEENEDEISDGTTDQKKNREDEKLIYSNDGEVYLEEGRWFYFDQIEVRDKVVYQMFMDLIDHKEELGYEREITIPGTDEGILQDFYRIYDLVKYDHPEYFYLSDPDKSDRIDGTYKMSDGQIIATYSISKVYKNEAELIKIFDKAADRFLADIDMTQSMADIEMQIHDKLIEIVTYDTGISENRYEGFLAHTAYGALVENNKGEANYAVCDGYSLAFEYLLQKKGIKSGVLIGGGYSDSGDGGPHAWNVVYLSDGWYEVDCTWDDKDLHIDYPDIANEIMAKEESYAYATHRYYNLTTDRMRNTPADNRGTVTINNTVYYLGGNSPTKHVVGQEVGGEDAQYREWISGFYPHAEGTKYSYKYE